MIMPNRVVIRTYCEVNCDCPNCHKGNAGAVEKCVYCQLKWANKGQYDPEWSKLHGLPPNPEYTPRKNNLTDDEILKKLVKEWRENHA